VDNPAALKIPYLTSTAHLFDRCHLEGGFGPVAKGIVLGESGGPNNEFMRCEACWFTGFSNAGFHVPNRTGQSFANQFSDCAWSKCKNAYASAISSAHFFDCNFDACDLCLWFNGGAYAPVSVTRCVSENCKQFVLGRGIPALSIRDSRLAANAAPAARPPAWGEWVAAGGDVSITDTTFDTATNGLYLRAGDNGDLFLRHVTFSTNYVPVALDTPPRFSVTSVNSRYDGSKFVPNGVYRQDNLPLPFGTGGRASQLGTLTAPPGPATRGK
jgi:hypothetical protein